MATSSIAELRRIRTAEIYDPETVVELGRLVVKTSGKGAGDECNFSPEQTDIDWTILDQVGVAALETGNDGLAAAIIFQTFAD
jgi:hypothetical protein